MYRETPRTFDAVHWAGTNAVEVLAFINRHHHQPASVTEQPDGMLISRDGSYLSLFIPPDGRVMFGPLFGTNTAQAQLFVKTADEFAAQYESVP